MSGQTQPESGPGTKPILIHGAWVYDGRGGPALEREVLVREGKVEALLERGDPGPEDPQLERVDAQGCWLTPGFIDLHTHYGAEVELAPGLGESVRHGVTTVMLGSCGLSMAVGDPVELAGRLPVVLLGMVQALQSRRDPGRGIGPTQTLSVVGRGPPLIFQLA